MRHHTKRALPALLVTLLVASACSGGGDSSETTTTLAATTTPAPTTTAAATTTSEATTTTLFVPPEVRVRIDGDEEAAAVVTDLFLSFADPSVIPDVPQGLIDHTSGVVIGENTVIDGEIFSAQLEAGRVGVVMLGEDVVLIADDGSGWRVVGAKLSRYGLDAWYGEPVRHVLVVGTDARSGQSQPLFRADSIHILSSNIAEGAGSILGFPRDTYVETSYGTDKFTNVNATSETHTEEMVEIAADLSGLPLDGYILTGFLGFAGMINEFGGVLVNIPFAMADEKSKAYFSAGLQRLWGLQALAFSQNRRISGGDFTRSFHQGLVMLAGLESVLERGIAALPGLLFILDGNTWTNLPPSTLLTLAAGAFEVEYDRVTNEVLEGSVQNIAGASVVVLDEDAAEVIFRDLDDGVLDSQ